MVNTEFFHGWGQLLGSNTAGVTFTGYGPVMAKRIGSLYLISGEARITAITNGSSSDYLTGVKISNVLSALGITAELTYKGNYYNMLSCIDGSGNNYSESSMAFYYQYGIVAEHDNGILRLSRYYETAGTVGGWSSNLPMYYAGNLWVFSFAMEG